MAFRLAEALQPWSMAEIFVIGCAVALVKIADLAEHGLTQISAEKHITGVDECNLRYLSAKADWGHKITPADLD